MKRSFWNRAAILFVLLSAIALPAWGLQAVISRPTPPPPPNAHRVPEGESWPAYVIPSGVLMFGGIILARRTRTKA
jgi:hypothetical protein